MDNIKVMLLISGKRKSGKDFFSIKLHERLGSDCSQIIRISEPIKSEWSKKLNLNLNELLSDGPYKERYRRNMIEWSDDIRCKDYGYFCREAMRIANREVIIVSDIRRKNDIKYFKESYGDKIKTIRIKCSEDERILRGYKFEIGIDDVPSECDLDDYDAWDMEIINEKIDPNIIIADVLKKFITK